MEKNIYIFSFFLFVFSNTLFAQDLLQQAEVDYKRGTTLHTQGRYQEAIQAFTEALAKNPNHDKAYNDRGISKKSLGEDQGALEDYTKSILLNPNNADTYFNRALTRVKLKDYAGAKMDYAQAIYLNPQDAEAYYYRGLIRQDENDFNGAIEDYSTALQLQPSNIRVQPAYYDRGHAYFALKQLQEAKTDYQRFLEVTKNSIQSNLQTKYETIYQKFPELKTTANTNSFEAKIHLNNGVQKYNKGEYAGAIQDYSLAIEMNPSYADAFYNRGLAKGQIKDYSGAIQDFSEAIRIDPTDYEAYNQRGKSKHNLEDYTDAIQDYTTSLQLDQRSALIFYNRALSKIKIFDYVGALQDLDQALIINPQQDIAYFEQGNCKMDTRDYTGAIEAYTLAIQLNPLENYYFNRALSYYTLGSLQEAQQDFNKVVQLNPNNFTGWNKLGLSQYYSNQYDSALQSYNQCINLNPNFAEVYNNRGIIWHINEDYLRAEEDYNRAIQLDPQYSLPYYNLALIYYNQYRYPEALEYSNKSLEINPSYADAYLIRGNVYLEQKEYYKALQDYQNAILINPNVPLYYYNQGLAHYNLKQYDQCITSTTETIRLDPNYQKAYEKRASAFVLLNKNREALKDYETLISILPPSDARLLTIYYQSGELYNLEGEVAFARQSYEKYLQLTENNTDPVILDQRAQVSRRLSELPQQTTNPKIIDLKQKIQDKSYQVRIQAALQAKELGTEATELLPLLQKMATQDENTLARKVAEEVLKKLKPASPQDILKQILASNDRTLFTGLAQLDLNTQNQLVSLLAPLLSDPQMELEMRIRVAMALSKFGKLAKPALPQLIRALKEENQKLRQYSAQAIGSIGSDAIEAQSDLMALLLSAPTTSNPEDQEYTNTLIEALNRLQQ